jgi:hypothetical protein
MVFELIDLENLGQNALQEFQNTVGSAARDDRDAFDQAAGRLIAKIEFAYGVAAKLAQREPTLEGTEAVWAKLVAICDEIARQLRALGEPALVGCAAYDRLLDYRNAAEGRRQLHA